MSEITNAERLDRLEHAERFLRGWKKYTKYCVKPVKSFDIAAYYKECGTAACAAGGMMLHPWFIKRGFSLRSIRGVFNTFGVCAKFFGVSQEEAVDCFSPGAYYQVDDAVSTSMVADKIHALIEKYREAEA